MTIVLCGVGNRMRSDDGIGSLIASDLMSYKLANVTIYDCETTPENYIDKVVAVKPSWLIFIDACNFEAKPGEFKMFHDDEIKEISYGLLSTHTLPLTLTIELIKKQHNCKVSLLGIQPKSFSMGENLSVELSFVRGKVVEFIKKLVKDSQNS